MAELHMYITYFKRYLIDWLQGATISNGIFKIEFILDLQKIWEDSTKNSHISHINFVYY